MKSTVLLVLTATIITVSSSCEKSSSSILPSSNITTESRIVYGFDGIDASTTFKVFVSFSDTAESIEIKANDNLHRYIEVKEQGGNLVIKLMDGLSVSGGNLVLEAYVTTSTLSEFSASDVSGIFLENELNKSEVFIDMSDASSFSGEINANTLYCDLSDVSDASLSGSAVNLNLDVSDASTFLDYSMVADVLRADISDASNVYVTVNEVYTANLSGASNLFYRGNAVNKNSDTSGASNIIKTD